MKIILAASCLAFLALVTCSPQHIVRRRDALQIPNYTQLSQDQLRHLQNRGFGPTVPTPFRPTVAYVEREDDDEEDDEDIVPASTQARRPVYSDDAYIQNVIPIQTRPAQRQHQQQQQQQHHQQQQQQHNQQQNHQQQQQQQVRRQQQQQYSQTSYGKQDVKDKNKLEEEEKEEEPDRLTLLLPQSRFDCTSKNTGYYADEELGCEVFHYCQDNAKHSWICPEGFTFHQVHLICMPPGGDNICSKSSQYHFVNEYLYKPVNLEEHQAKPNVSLRYSDRYYPENYYQNNQYDNDDEEGEQGPPAQYHHQSRKPIRVGFQQQQVQAPQQQVLSVVRRPSPTLRPETTIGQVFRSPEEVNISLQQRRPNYVTQRYREELGGY